MDRSIEKSYTDDSKIPIERIKSRIVICFLYGEPGNYISKKVGSSAALEFLGQFGLFNKPWVLSLLGMSCLAAGVYCCLKRPNSETISHHDVSPIPFKQRNIRHVSSYPFKQPKKNKNLGNTCYFNSALQALYFTKSIRESLYWLQNHFKGNENLKLVNVLYSLMKKADNDEDNTDDLKQVFRAIRNKHDHLMIGNQEDSYQLLLTLIGGVCNEIKTLTADSDELETQKDEHWIDFRNIFTGRFLTVFVYETCPHVELILEDFTSLEIPICDMPKEKINFEQGKMHNALKTIQPYLRQDIKGLQLENGFACFEAVEEFNERDVECNSCSRDNRVCKEEIIARSGKVYKRGLILQPPPVLVLHIERFMENGWNKFEKNTSFVQYPETLDLTPFCSVASTELFENEFLYELYAVIVHKGTVEYGHYYAFVNTSRQCNKEKWDRLIKESRVDEDILRSKLERIFEKNCTKDITKTNDELPKIKSDWYSVSDENIEPVTTEKVLNQNDAYILFYEAKTYTDGDSQTYCCSIS